MFLTFSKFILLVLPFLISVAFLTLLERKLLSLVGYRLGPNKVSFFGILQPMADAAKLANKQVNSLSNYSFFFYYLSSFFMLMMSILLSSLIFSNPSVISLKYSLVLFMLILGLNSFNSIICGWSVYSKFSIIGSLRTVSQLISYESVIYICLFFFLSLFLCFSFFHFSFCFSLFPVLMFPICFYIWVPSFLAELNRTPYDFSEGESELVSGFNTEFGSSSFTLIFLSEYGNIIFFSFLGSFIFFFFFTPAFFLIILFGVIWFRSLLPRYRFDKLMFLAWKFFIPFLTVYFCLFFLFSTI